MPDRTEERLRAVERALADGAYRIDELDERTDTQDRRLAELEAAVLALRGYVGNVRAVNRRVEHRADAALSRVEALESGEE